MNCLQRQRADDDVQSSSSIYITESTQYLSDRCVCVCKRDNLYTIYIELKIIDN